MRVKDRRVVRATEPHTEAQRCKIQAIHSNMDDPAEAVAQRRRGKRRASRSRQGLLIFG